MERRTSEEYLSKHQLGNIVACRVGEQMNTGKVVSIVDNTDVGKVITIKTKNGSVYYPHISEIVWIKNGTHWPQGIFNALKESKKG